MNILKHHSLYMISMHIRTYVATDDTNRIDLYVVTVFILVFLFSIGPDSRFWEFHPSSMTLGISLSS